MAFAVCRGNRPDRLARVSVSQIAGGDILGDHAACTDDDIVADTHPVYDDGIAGNPDVIPDVDIRGIFRHRGPAVRVHAHAFRGNQRMVGRQNGNVRADRDIIADIDARVIHDSQIKIGKKVFTDEQMAAVVDLYGPLKIAGLADTSKDVAEQLLPLRVVFIHHVEFAACLVRLVFQVFELLLARIEHLAGKDFFFFCHESTS